MKIKIDKDKIYARMRQAVVYGSVYIATVVFEVWAFCQNTIY